MNSLNKVFGKIGTALLAVALLLTLTLGVFQVQKSFRNAAPVSALNTSSIKTFTGSINAETTIVTGTASKKLHIVSVDLNSSGAGIVVLKDGTGGTTVQNVYLAANTPRQLTDLYGSNGLALTQNILTATLAGATLTCTVRYWEE